MEREHHDNSHTTVSVHDFQTDEVEQPVSFKDGDSITRDNFTSWFVRSFAVSRGDPTVQYAYVRWSAAQGGSDYQSILQNFLYAGSEECLSEFEKEYVLRSYNRVKRHATEDHKNLEHNEYETSTNPISELEHYAYFFTNDTESKQYQDELLQEFDSIITLENLSPIEFRQCGLGKNIRKFLLHGKNANFSQNK